MLAIEVTLNGQKIALAGASDLCVLNGIVSAIGKLGPDSSGTHHPDQTGQDVTLRVGGLTSRNGAREDEHLTWVTQDLALGDLVAFRLVETDAPDLYVVESTAGGNVDEISERQLYDFAKREYERLKDKFGSVER